MNTVPTLRDIDHVQGPLSAALLIMHYSNYQCPQSGKAHKTIRKLQESLNDQLCIVFRHFPLAQYPQSQKAAETAEAANSQEKFWEMHNKLFDNQNALDDASLVEYAIELGLDLSTFLYEITNGVHKDRIQSDVDSGKQYGVETTPTFFIGVRHQGSQDLETLVKRILVVAVDTQS